MPPLGARRPAARAALAALAAAALVFRAAAAPEALTAVTLDGWVAAVPAGSHALIEFYACAPTRSLTRRLRPLAHR